MMRAELEAITPSADAPVFVEYKQPVVEGWAVRASAAARLSFTLIDLNGETGRKNGMASLAVASPEFRVLASHSDSVRVIIDRNSDGYAGIIQDFVERLQRAIDGVPAKITVESGLPQHSGFGSKTTTLLTIGKAYAALNERAMPTDEIAFYAGRAGTSGGSVNLTDRGGFIIDGGHQVASDFDKDPKRYLVPSRFAGAARRKPPVLISTALPPWPILMIMPAGEHVHGQPEADFFRRTLPIPLAEARKTAHVVFMNLAPAVLEGDYHAFCDAFNRITFDTYFKQLQIQNQNAAVHKVLEESRRNGIDAIGMSSMGPGCFSFTREPAKAIGWLKEMKRDGVVADFWFTRASNQGAQVERVPNMEQPAA
jgi:beta-ribofuranosylaminobenzene 5'-phosphate synthase